MSGTRISVPSTGNIQIADTGWYQVTWGFSPTSTATSQFGVVVNGAATPAPLGPNTSRIDFDVPTGVRIITTESVIIQAPTNPTTVIIKNVGAAAITLNNGSQTAGGGPIAYVTIIKISN
jgi:hypothetical protein